MNRLRWTIVAATLGLVLAAQPSHTQDAETLPEKALKPSFEGDPVPDRRKEEEGLERQPGPAHSERPSPPLLSALKGVEPKPEKTESAEDEQYYKRQENREIADLKAQQEMALWAEGMFYANLFTTIISALALIAIVCTLRHTKRAADASVDMVAEAKATTTAAQATVDVTRQIGQAQTRAYLDLSVVEIRHNVPRAPELFIEFRNTGATPARSVVITFSMKPFAKQGVIPINEVEKRLHDIGSQSQHVIRETIWLQLSLFDESWRESDDILTVSGLVLYEDVFGDSHRLEFSLFTKPKDYLAGKRLTIATEGNSST